MKRFDFVARQGQHQHVADVLRFIGLDPDIVGPTISWRGCHDPNCFVNCGGYADTQQLFIVAATLPPGVSKNSVNRVLRAAGVPGA